MKYLMCACCFIHILAQLSKPSMEMDHEGKMSRTGTHMYMRVSFSSQHLSLVFPFLLFYLSQKNDLVNDELRHEPIN